MLWDLRENFVSSKDVNETLMSDSTVKKVLRCDTTGFTCLCYQAKKIEKHKNT